MYIQAVDSVIDGTWDNAYCLVRPPGHHAERDKGSKFVRAHSHQQNCWGGSSVRYQSLSVHSIHMEHTNIILEFRMIYTSTSIFSTFNTNIALENQLGLGFTHEFHFSCVVLSKMKMSCDRSPLRCGNFRCWQVSHVASSMIFPMNVSSRRWVRAHLNYNHDSSVGRITRVQFNSSECTCVYSNLKRNCKFTSIHALSLCGHHILAGLCGVLCV